MLTHTTPSRNGKAYIFNLNISYLCHKNPQHAQACSRLEREQAVAQPDNIISLKKRPKVVVQPDNSGLQKKAAYHELMNRSLLSG